MKLKALAIAAVLATTASLASAGNVFDLGDITLDGALFASPPYALNTQIDDTWNFTLTGSNDVSALLSRNFSTAAGAIGNFAATISGGSLAASQALQLDTTASSQTLTFASTLGAGDYSVSVSGLVQRNRTAYTFSVDVTPVPEPETYALMLAGLGLVGFLAKRRKLA
jgi:hypothetical protein